MRVYFKAYRELPLLYDKYANELTASDLIVRGDGNPGSGWKIDEDGNSVPCAMATWTVQMQSKNYLEIHQDYKPLTQEQVDEFFRACEEVQKVANEKEAFFDEMEERTANNNKDLFWRKFFDESTH